MLQSFQPASFAVVSLIGDDLLSPLNARLAAAYDPRRDELRLVDLDGALMDNGDGAEVTVFSPMADLCMTGEVLCDMFGDWDGPLLEKLVLELAADAAEDDCAVGSPCRCVSPKAQRAQRRRTRHVHDRKRAEVFAREPAPQLEPDEDELSARGRHRRLRTERHEMRSRQHRCLRRVLDSEFREDVLAALGSNALN